jgi:hypothetical protein
MPQVTNLDPPLQAKLPPYTPRLLRIALTFIMGIVNPRDINSVYALHLGFWDDLLRLF